MIVSAEPGLRIMLVQFGGGLLFGISVTLLEDAYRTFMEAGHSDKLIVTAFVPPLEEFLNKTRLLWFVFSDCHFYLK